MTQVTTQEQRTSRRSFLRTAAGAAAIAAAGSATLSGCGDKDARLFSARGKGLIRKDTIILFQGDSITDAGRDRNREQNANDSGALGKGYAFLAAAELLASNADDNLKIYNRGISGHKVFQLAERWDKDCLAIKPDVLSILIGVNDIWHKLNGHYDGTVKTYQDDLDALLDRTLKALPEVRLVICEPFVLRCGAVNDKWFPEFDSFRAASKQVAAKYRAIFVPFQTMFDEAVKKAPPAHWAADGVHPTMAGAALMARTWIDAVA